MYIYFGNTLQYGLIC